MSVNDFVINPLFKSQGKIIGLISLKDIFEKICDEEMQDDDIHNPITLMSVILL